MDLGSAEGALLGGLPVDELCESGSGLLHSVRVWGWFWGVKYCPPSVSNVRDSSGQGPFMWVLVGFSLLSTAPLRRGILEPPACPRYAKAPKCTRWCPPPPPQTTRKMRQGGRGRTRGGERPMGTTAYGGKGSKGRAANGDRPIGAARCRRDQHTQGAPPPPPRRPPAGQQTTGGRCTWTARRPIDAAQGT